jgi:hypothetical protein
MPLFKEKGVRLLVPEPIRFNTIPLIATWNIDLLISTVAFMIKVNSNQDLSSETHEKALCVWLNSTFIISYLRVIFATMEGRLGHIRGWHFKIFPFPDLSNSESFRI